MNDKKKRELLISPENSLLLVIDIQEKLWPHIAGSEQILFNVHRLIQASRLLSVQTLVTEQYPKGLGPSIPELKETIGNDIPVCEKTAFGCLGDEAITTRLKGAGRKHLILCGIETHVCVLQTALEALEQGFRVGVVADAVGSRQEENKKIALDRMAASGATILSTEMILFEWMRTSRNASFKEISRLVR